MAALQPLYHDTPENATQIYVFYGIFTRQCPRLQTHRLQRPFRRTPGPRGYFLPRASRPENFPGAAGGYQQMAAAAQKHPARRLQACRMSALHRAPLHPPTRPELCSAEASPVKTANSSGSEFLRAVGNVAQDRAWEVMDELMDTLKIVNGKAYNSVLK